MKSHFFLKKDVTPWPIFLYIVFRLPPISICGPREQGLISSVHCLMVEYSRRNTTCSKLFCWKILSVAVLFSFKFRTKLFFHAFSIKYCFQCKHKEQQAKKPYYKVWGFIDAEKPMMDLLFCSHGASDWKS